MALDHLRDFLGSSAINPTYIAQANAALPFSRWITHLCAPLHPLCSRFAGVKQRRRDPWLSYF
jgi:uncharacterized membrane protein